MCWVAERGRGGRGDDLGVLEPGLRQAGSDLVAVHPRHAYVEQDEVRAVLECDAHSLVARGGDQLVAMGT
jgi:hypothetical protein